MNEGAAKVKDNHRGDNGSLGITDEQAHVDKLGLDQYVSGLADFIAHCSTPMTLSLQGGWGAGKTTLFGLISQKDVIKNNCDILEINTWQFSVAGYSDDLVTVLMARMLDQLANGEGGSDDAKGNGLRGKLEKMLGLLNRKTVGKAAATAGTAVFEHLTGVTTIAVLLDKVINSESGSAAGKKDDSAIEALPQQSDFQLFGLVDSVKQNLNKIIEEKYGNQTAGAKPGKNRLVVFIDDLDRLEPRKAVDLLEGIKNFLDCERCVFVLAIDEEVVFEGIKEKYGEGGEKRKRLFFDKIIQVPFRLPVASYDVGAYMQSLLPDDLSDGREKRYEQIANAFMWEQGSREVNNPRTIKRHFNQLSLYESILKAGESPDSGKGELDETDQLMLFLLIVFMGAHPSSFIEIANEVRRGEEEGICGHDALNAFFSQKLEDESSEEEDPARRLRSLIKGGDQNEADAPNELERFAGMVSRVAQIALSTELEGAPIRTCLENWRLYEGGNVFEGFQSRKANEELEAAGFIEKPQAGKGWLPTEQGKRAGIRVKRYEAGDGASSTYCVYDDRAASWGSEVWSVLYRAAAANKPQLADAAWCPTGSSDPA